ncbi:unnamed protein product [Porites lobata]|uniref:ZMYM2-like/QRICH1 C-terminal domain-containing protein n=1 Tax=Porites lobata TaxID=104759 RepID=A0ABN8QM80_9CNID|nr:unnamed protein product [Porites lobata]
MSVNPTESNDLEVDIVLPNFDLNVLRKKRTKTLIIGEKTIPAKKLTTSSTAKNRKRVKKNKLDWQRFNASCQGKMTTSATLLPFNILKDDAFSRSRRILAAKRKSLVKEGRGNKPNASCELTDEEEAKLFEAGKFGNHNPLALQRTLLWFLSMQFGFRARDESRKLCWGDIVLDVDAVTGREVLVWTAERGSKTSQGLKRGHQRQFCPKPFATGTNRCPVLYYNLFKARLNHQTWRQSQVWYKG